MKYIVAIVQPARLEAVKEQLGHAGVHGLTVTDVQGMGRQKGHTEVYRGHEYEVNLIRKVKLEIAIPDDVADAAVEAIIKGARTGNIGDGKIFVMELEDAVRIRTGERAEDAI